MATTATQHWPVITLAWRQRVAAFWLLAWPSWLGSFVLVAVVSSGWSVADLRLRVGVLSGLANAFFLIGEGLLVRRMVRKQYRSFRLAVVREAGPDNSTLSPREAIHVWLKVIWPQIAFLVVIWILLFWSGANMDEKTTRAISTLSLWGRILVVGPFGIFCAVPAQYPGFRLEACGQRFV
jgi:hypothetical protein